MSEIMIGPWVLLPVVYSGTGPIPDPPVTATDFIRVVSGALHDVRSYHTDALQADVALAYECEVYQVVVYVLPVTASVQ